MKKSKSYLLIAITSLLILGCKKESSLENCGPLSTNDDGVLLKLKQDGIKLSLPKYTDFRRGSKEFGECDYALDFSIDYLWYEGKLIPNGTNNIKIPKEKYLPVRVYYRNAYSRIDRIPKNDKEKWAFENAISHTKFPLELYPQYYWDDPANPSKESIQKSIQNPIWGIKNTAHKNVLYKTPFTATCSILKPDSTSQESSINGEFSKFGDSKCRGWLSAEKNGKSLYVMIDVWAYPGADENQTAIREINKIYDATAEQLESFIQE